MNQLVNLGLVVGVSLLCVGIWPGVSQAQSLSKALSGRIVVQVEERGEAWYINPGDEMRYYLGRPADAFQLMQELGLGISDADLALIPRPKQAWDGRQDLMARVRGKIVLQVEQQGEAWYVNPTNGKRYYLGKPADAFRLMTKFGIGIINSDLWEISPDLGVTAVQAVGVKTSLDEYVEMSNGGELDRSLAGWSISNGGSQVFTFPSGSRLPAGESVKVYTAQGDLHFGASEEVWDDGTGGVEVFDDRGTYVQKYSYETAPASSLLSTIPFTTQAPSGQWNTSPFDEACEEAILVMLHAWDSSEPLTSTYTEGQILQLVDWELKTFGFHQDTSAANTTSMASDFYGLTVYTSTDVSISKIKQLIASGHPVIVPVWGRNLNPHYRYGGPYYHMVLIVGYDQDSFITMDPGTSYGDQYYYNQQMLFDAIHDFVYPESLTYLGSKVMVVVNP